jgi:hypothetical protein
LTIDCPEFVQSSRGVVAQQQAKREQFRVGGVDGIDDIDDWFLPVDGVVRRITLIVVRCSGSSLGIDYLLGVIVSVSQLVALLTGWSAEISPKGARRVSLGIRVMGIGGENDLLSLEMKIENTNSGRQMIAPITANPGKYSDPEDMRVPPKYSSL